MASRLRTRPSKRRIVRAGRGLHRAYLRSRRHPTALRSLGVTGAVLLCFGIVLATSLYIFSTALFIVVVMHTALNLPGGAPHHVGALWAALLQTHAAVQRTTGRKGRVPAHTREIAQALHESIDHYAHLLERGKGALGTSRYPDAATAARALDDPDSAASRFHAFAARTHVEQDESYVEAFTVAEAILHAFHMPRDAAARWRGDMAEAQRALAAWVSSATAWQRTDVTDAGLAEAERRVVHALDRARAEVATIVEHGREGARGS